MCLGVGVRPSPGRIKLLASRGEDKKWLKGGKAHARAWGRPNSSKGAAIRVQFVQTAQLTRFFEPRTLSTQRPRPTADFHVLRSQLGLRIELHCTPVEGG